MEELQLKYVEIAFDKERPQSVGTEINISTKIDRHVGNLEYKFIVGRGGVWNTIQEFSEKNQCIWRPVIEGDYMVMVQARDKYGKKSLDYLAREDYSIVDGEVANTMNEEVSNENVVNESEINIEEETIGCEEKSHISILTDSDNFEENENEITDEALLDKNNIVKLVEVERIKSEPGIIEDVLIDKKELVVGEKCSIQVLPKNENGCLYRFFIKRYENWDIVRDYDTANILKYTATEEGEKEFLIQCKKIESTESFDDYRTIKVVVKNIAKIEITNFKCLTSSLIVGEKLEFEVETNINQQQQEQEQLVLLYKFYKIFKDGRSVCIQDYSTKNHVYYKEMEQGSYRILCLVKSILSNKEYEDRAVLMYSVKPYKPVKINSFVASLNSPQTTETAINFTSEVEGGNNLLYRYKVNGPIEVDTGFISEQEFSWKPMEPGEYDITLYIKDLNYSGEYEASKKIAFTIEKKGSKPVKILDIVIDKEKKIIVGEPINIMIKAEGGTRLQYSFIIKKDKRNLEKIDYGKSNWINYVPKEVGEYEVEVMVKDRYSDKSYDTNAIVYLKSMEYLPGEIDYIIFPYKETYLIGDTIEFECIIQNTQNVLVKYETKINGNVVEETEFSKNKKLRFNPKISGKYTIEVYAKNIKCKGEYDSKKQITINVNEAYPVIETKIITDKFEGSINEEFTFEATSRGGKDVCYEFYLMENNEWMKVQEYSRKHHYSFIPFAPGKYKILALAKSYYKKVSYEDYDQIVFYVKEKSKKQ
ncbi:triple tyrosine motif-containing protein [Clostridium sp. C2-6-12]|uniref:triple tyrosine motif-containing protein n=1 Tax=Clostridium sp. C2-6-12 TaxID=2698832 RepID=UPI00136B0306|nr:triple tyrosine motif-containing protein [Clostridium sp. C2-6-12]